MTHFHHVSLPISPACSSQHAAGHQSAGMCRTVLFVTASDADARPGALVAASAYGTYETTRFIQEGVFVVGNRPNPWDVHVMGLAVVKNEVRALYARDGVIDELEEASLGRLTVLHSDISGVRLREQASEAWVKGGVVTDYVIANFKQAGATIRAIDLPANVVAFPSGNDPLEAA